MSSVPLFDAKNRLSELIDSVQHGEEVSITRRGVAVARLIAAQPVSAEAGNARTRAAFQRLHQLRKGKSLDGDLKSIAREGLD